MAAITDLATLTTIAGGDWLVVNDVSAAGDRKITRDNLLGGIGTWTPALYFGGAAVGMTYSGRGGNYVRAGNAVLFAGFMALSAKGSSSGNAVISGLPVTPSGDTSIANVFFSGMATNWINVVAYTSSGLLYLAGTQAAAASLSILSHTDFGNSSTLFFSGMYLSA